MDETALWQQHLGQLAYEACRKYFSHRFPKAMPHPPWWRLSIQEVEEWEAIATAVERAVLTRQTDG
jgi:hypothetical protein